MSQTENRRKFSLIEDETGEIVETIGENDTFRILRGNQRKFIETKVKNFNRKEAFVKVFINVLLKIMDELSNAEFVIAMKLVKFISYESCALELPQGGLYLPATLKGMSAELDVGYDVFRKVISVLMKKDIIRKTKRLYGKKEYPCYVVNPYVFCYGQNINKADAVLFKDSKWATMNE